MKAGVATHVCEKDKIDELQDSLCQLQSPYPEDIADVLDKFTNQASFHKKDFVLKPHLHLIEKCFSGSSVEEILQNLEKVMCLKSL